MAETARLNIVVDPRRAVAGMKRIGGSMKKLKSAVFGLQGAFAAIGGAAILISLKNAQLDMEKFTLALKAGGGGAQAAAEDLKFLGEQTERLGLNFKATVGGYSKFRAAAATSSLTLEQQREIFLGVAEAGAALRLSADDQKGALKALEQMMSKGNVQAEELRGQLGERLPGAFAMAAQAMGVTQVQLNKMLDTGQVLAEELLPKLATVFRDRFGKAAQEAATTASAEFERFNNALFRTRARLANTGIVDIMGALAGAIGETLEKASEKVDDYKDRITDIVVLTIRFVGELFDAAQPVFTIIGAIASWAMSVLQGIGEGWNMLPNVVRQMGLIGAVFLGPKVRIVLLIVTAAFGLIDEFMAKMGEMAKGTADFIRSHRHWFDSFAKMGGVKGVFWSAMIPQIDPILVKLDAFAKRQAKRVSEGQSYESELKKIIDEYFPDEGEVAGMMSKLMLDPDAGKEWAETIIKGLLDRLALMTPIVEEAGEELKKALVGPVKWGGQMVDGIMAGGKQYLAGIKSLTEEIAEATNNAFQSMEDELVAFVQTGKFNFKSLVDSIIADLARVMIRAYIMKPLMAQLGFSATANAKGGIMTPSGPVALKSYARGGIANRPQMAMFGEGAQPEAYVPLPDGRSIPVSMSGASGNSIVTNINVSVDGGSGGNQESNAHLATTISNVINKRFNEQLQNAVRPGGMLNPQGNLGVQGGGG